MFSFFVCYSFNHKSVLVPFRLWHDLCSSYPINLLGSAALELRPDPDVCMLGPLPNRLKKRRQVSCWDPGEYVMVVSRSRRAGK